MLLGKDFLHSLPLSFPDPHSRLLPSISRPMGSDLTAKRRGVFFRGFSIPPCGSPLFPILGTCGCKGVPPSSDVHRREAWHLIWEGQERRYVFVFGRTWRDRPAKSKCRSSPGRIFEKSNFIEWRRTLSNPKLGEKKKLTRAARRIPAPGRARSDRPWTCQSNPNPNTTFSPKSALDSLTSVRERHHIARFGARALFFKAH